MAAPARPAKGCAWGGVGRRRSRVGGRVLALVGCLAALHCRGQGWERIHTFTNSTYTLLACGTTQHVCLSSTFRVATSSDLTNWTEHGEALLPASLHETTEFSVDLEPLQVTTLPTGGFLMVVHKTERPQLGNLRIDTLVSLKSPDGLVWSEGALIDDYCDGVDNTFVAQVGQRLVFMYGDYPLSGWVTGCLQNRAWFHAYDASSNAWQTMFSTTTMPGSYHLFADNESVYFVRRECPSLVIGSDPDLTLVERSSDGKTWEALPGTGSLLYSADAYDGRILAADTYYSPGTGWQPSTNVQLRNVAYNGDTVVGTLGNDLVVSRDFGRSWQRQSFLEVPTLNLVEWNGLYVGLVTGRFPNPDPGSPALTGSSVFAVKSRAPRATHSGALVLTIEARSLAFEAQANVVYQVETTASFSAPNWVAYGLPLVSTAARVTVPLGMAPATGGFFRVVSR